MAIEQSVEDILEMPQRKLVVAKNDIDLSNNSQNDIFILMFRNQLVLLVEEEEDLGIARSTKLWLSHVPKEFATNILRVLIRKK